MEIQLTVGDLFTAQKATLRLTWLAGEGGANRLLEPLTARYPGLALVGHLNFIHPNRVQVIGENEIAYLEALDADQRAQDIARICSKPSTAVIVIAQCSPLADLELAANAADLPVLLSELPSPVVIDHLQYYLTRALAPSITEHGVYMEVMGMGVFLTGAAGIGKSELALELLSRNHRLIADDAVEFIKVGPDVLVGQSPAKSLSDFMEVRGLGIINVRDMFGETAVRHKKKLHIILRLEQLDDFEPGSIDRLQPHQRTRNILGVDIPEVTLFVAPGRNLAVLVETATRTYILRMWGIDSVEAFMQRQRALIEKTNK